MRRVLNVASNKVELVEDQVAVEMIANGQAVPSIETMDADLPNLETGKTVGNVEAK